MMGPKTFNKMGIESLEKERQSLLEWIEKIKSNNSNEYEDYYLIETLKEKISDINAEINKLISK